MQAGGHRFDPDQLHQILILCFQIAAIVMAAIWKQAEFIGRFLQPQGWIFPAKGKIWMFDNEIDWVKRIWSAFLLPLP